MSLRTRRLCSRMILMSLLASVFGGSPLHAETMYRERFNDWEVRCTQDRFTDEISCLSMTIVREPTAAYALVVLGAPSIIGNGASEEVISKTTETLEKILDALIDDEEFSDTEERVIRTIVDELKAPLFEAILSALQTTHLFGIRAEGLVGLSDGTHSLRLRVDRREPILIDIQCSSNNCVITHPLLLLRAGFEGIATGVEGLDDLIEELHDIRARVESLSMTIEEISEQFRRGRSVAFDLGRLDLLDQSGTVEFSLIGFSSALSDARERRRGLR